MLTSKKKLKLMVIEKLLLNNLCFFIVSGKRKFLSKLFKKSSVLHISFFKDILDIQYLGKYAYSYVCLFKYKKFVKFYNLLNDKRILIHQICFNGSFLNFYCLMDEYLIKSNSYIEILHIVLMNLYLLNYVILNIIIYILDFFYFLIQKKCLI